MSAAVQTRSSDTSPLTVRVVGFWRRAAAGIVDGAILATVFGICDVGANIVLDGALPRLSQLGPHRLLESVLNGSARAELAAWLLAVVTVLYFGLFTWLLGQTPGKRLFAIRVIDAYGERPTWWRALLRSLAYAPSGALLMFGFLWIGFDREKRGLHDWLADTYVIFSR